MISFLNVFKPVGKWLFKFFVGLVISNAIMWLVKYNFDKFIKKFNDSIVQFIKDSNKFIYTTIVNTDKLLTEGMETIFSNINSIISKFEEWFAVQFLDISSLVQDIIFNSTFINWVENVLQTIISKSGDFLKSKMEVIIQPVLISIIPVETMAANVSTKLDNMEFYILTALKTFWANLMEVVQGQFDKINNNVDTFTTNINSLISFCNSSIDAMKQNMNTVCTTLDSYDQTLEERKAECLDIIRSTLKNVQVPPGTQPQGTLSLDSVKSQLCDLLLVPVPNELNMNFEEYRLVPPTIDREYYIIDITLPANNFYLDLAPYFIDIADLTAKVNNIKTALENISSRLSVDIDNSLPNIFSNSLEGKIKDTLLIILATALSQKLDEFSSFFNQKILDIGKVKEDYKQTIVDKRIVLTQALQEFEQTQNDLIKPLLDDDVQELIDDLTNGIVEDGDSVIVNIDDILPDTTDIDHILERFDVFITANEHPNIKDSEKWTPADMYRLLCNHFFRSERIALIVYLFSQDLKINPAKIKELQHKWSPSDQND